MPTYGNNKDGEDVTIRRYDASVAKFEMQGQLLNQTVDREVTSGKLTGDTARQCNRRIMDVEANWLNSEGIPGRPWFKHILYAARYTYAHLELPGLTEAIERGDWKAAKEQGKILEDALTRNTNLLRVTTGDLAK